MYLCSLLASLLQGRALQILKQVNSNSGYEGLRQVMRALQPRSRARALGLLTALTQVGSFKMRDSLLPQTLDLEKCFTQYEVTTGRVLQDSLKAAVLLRCVTGVLKSYILASADEQVDYDDLRELVLKLERSQQKWTMPSLEQQR